jgi:hypothetical protein
MGNPICNVKIPDTSNEVGNISGLKIFVISSFTVFRLPVTIAAIYYTFGTTKNNVICTWYLHNLLS